MKKLRIIQCLQNQLYHIQERTKEAIEEIREYLKEYGNISDVETGKRLFVSYLDRQNNGAASPYSQVELIPGDEIVITLVDGHIIYQDDFTPNHINDLITIIQEGYGRFYR